jgi:hypothetical protein
MKNRFLQFSMLAVTAASLVFASCSKEETKAATTGTTATTSTTEVTVLEKNMSLINKFTGTNCYYCGDWGWTLMEDLIKDHKADAVVVGAYSQNSFAKLFVSSIATDWDKRLPVSEGYPTFAPNFVDSWKSPVKDDLEGNISKTIANQNLAPVLVNSAYSVKVDGTTATVSVTTKFFKEAIGEYQLGVYVMENGVIGNQSGPKGGPNASHHNVLRGGNSSWGQALAKNNLSFFTVIGKKNGTKWDFVNASSDQKK